jgi:hypothetical protein
MVVSPANRPDPWTSVPLMRGTPGALLTALVLLAGTTLTWLAWNATMKAEEQRSRAELVLRVTDIQSAIESRLMAHEGLLRAGAGLVYASWPIRPDQWRMFANELRLATVYPGVQGIGFSARIRSRDDLEAWAGSLRIYGVDSVEGTIHSGRIPDTVIVMLEPSMSAIVVRSAST